MTWRTPTFDVIKMDAEIGSYNEDDPGPGRDALITKDERDAEPLSPS